MGAAPGCKPDQAPPPAPTHKTPPPEESPQRLKTATIQVGPIKLEAEIAHTAAARERGMMFRQTLAPDEAMLFVYPGQRDLAFWMKNTLVDLDLGYIAADGRLMQIEHLTARNLDTVHSREPAQFVLEVPAGWFARRGITEGAKVVIPREVALSADED
jgi:uncharacterized membrane protein (UPF0127 family)